MEYLARLLMHKILTGNRTSECVNATRVIQHHSGLHLHLMDVHALRKCVLKIFRLGGTSGGQMDKPSGQSRASTKDRSGC